jgi:hypothetical protein
MVYYPKTVKYELHNFFHYRCHICRCKSPEICNTFHLNFKVCDECKGCWTCKKCIEKEFIESHSCETLKTFFTVHGEFVDGMLNRDSSMGNSFFFFEDDFTEGKIIVEPVIAVQKIVSSNFLMF